MITHKLKDSVLLIAPNGKFGICRADDPHIPRERMFGDHPNFDLAIRGGKSLMLGRDLVCTEVAPTERGYRLTYHCRQHGLEVTTELMPVSGTDVVVQTNRVKNFGAQTVRLTGFSSAYLDGIAACSDEPWYQNDGLTLHICRSKWQGEGQWRQYTPTQLGLHPVGIHSFECSDVAMTSIGSWSTARFYPLAILEDRLHGAAWFMEIEGSHNWTMKLISSGGYEHARLSAAVSGCEETNGGWYHDLKPDAEYIAERAFWGICAGGFEAAVGDLTTFKRADSLVSFRDRPLPVVFNDYMNCLWSQQEPERIYPLIDRACEVGAEVFCIDGGWCEKVNGRTGLGDWLPKHEYYDMDGLRKIAQYIRSKNMLAGIWLELESCDRDAFGVGLEENAVLKRHDSKFGDVFTYNFGSEKVCGYLTERVRALYRAGFRYIKNDYNHTIGVGATNNYNGDSAAEGGIVNADRFYAFLDSLYAKFPDLIVENCSSGAMRCDNKILRRCYLQSTTDQELYFNNPSIVMGSLAVMPPEKAGIWAFPYPAAFPYDAEGRYTPFSADDAYAQTMADGRETVFNMVTAMSGYMYLSGRLDACDEKNFSLVKEGVRFYREIRRYIPQSRPIYPTGMLSLEEKKPAALALLAGDKLLLAAWNLTESETALSICLAPHTGATSQIEKTYPSDTACTLADHTLHAHLAAMAAAYFVISLQ